MSNICGELFPSKNKNILICSNNKYIWVAGNPDLLANILPKGKRKVTGINYSMQSASPSILFLESLQKASMMLP